MILLVPSDSAANLYTWAPPPPTIPFDGAALYEFPAVGSSAERAGEESERKFLVVDERERVRESQCRVQ